MEEFSIRFLLAISSLLGISDLPQESPSWKINSAWQTYESGYIAKLSSNTISSDCQKRPNAYIEFPQVIHSAHLVKLDGKPIFTMGDFQFKENRSFYGKPVLKCAQILHGKILEWEVASNSKYFGRFSYFPKIVDSKPKANIFFESFIAMAGGSLIVLALFCFTIFYGRISHQLMFSLVVSSFLWALYFIASDPGFFGFTYSMLEMHRIADLSVHIGTCLFANALRLEKLIGKKLFLIYAGNTAIAIFILLIGTSGDQLQFGTTLPFPMAITFFVVAIVKLLSKIREKSIKKSYVLQLLSLGLFVGAIINDILSVTGATATVILLPFGVVSGLFFFAVSVNEKIGATYLERDYLRKNLEKEVEQKTKKLNQAMNDLKTTQAELIQSAKLASLGTLSAGIAHEINNSLNFVNGALRPLEKEISKHDSIVENPKIIKLIHTMKEGLKLTFGIIKSLRNYTGLNQAKLNDVNIRKIVTGVLAILKSRLSTEIEIHLDIEENLTVYGSVVGLNQVFMNLINNSIDAMKGQGSLTIKSFSLSENEAEIKIQDSGQGIPKEIADRIFEPFFTTKDVGKGTGLGMHIVKMEMDRHGGSINIESKEGFGTTFTLILPKDAGKIKEEAA